MLNKLIEGYRPIAVAAAVLPVAIALAVLPFPVGAAGQETVDRLVELVRQQQSEIDALRAEVKGLASETKRTRDVARSASEMARDAQGRAARASRADARPPKTVASRNDKVTLTISGHVNRALMLMGDGDQTDLFHVDNDTEPTLINFVGEYRPTPGFTVGARFEAQFASNPSNVVSQLTENAAIGGINFAERHLEVYFASDRFGTLYLGQGNTASEGISEIDLSGTNIVTRSNFGTFGGGILFRNSATGVLSATSVGAAFSNFDGLGRDERVRYDTPPFAGFTLSGSLLQGNASDLALRYSGDFGGTKLAAGFAYAHTASTSPVVDSQWSGSSSVLFNNGINLTFAGGVQEAKASGVDDPVFLYGKLGYRLSHFNVGKTSFSVDGGITNDLAADGDEGFLYGFGFSQRVDDWNTEVYAGVRVYDLDRPGVGLDKIVGGMIGAIVTF